MGPTWGRQDPGGPHVGPMDLAIWDDALNTTSVYFNSLSLRGLLSQRVTLGVKDDDLKYNSKWYNVWRRLDIIFTCSYKTVNHIKSLIINRYIQALNYACLHLWIFSRFKMIFIHKASIGIVIILFSAIHNYYIFPKEYNFDFSIFNSKRNATVLKYSKQSWSRMRNIEVKVPLIDVKYINHV